MSAEWRIAELERRNESMRRMLDAALSRLSAVEQLANMLASSMGGNPLQGGASGSFFADPGAATIASGASASLTVVEVLAAGPDTLGSRTVVNPYPDATIADARLMLTRNRDGSYTVANQACAEEA